MELTSQVAQLLNNTLSPDGEVRRSASDALDSLSLNPDFSFSLISIAVGGGENQGQSIAAATYLKNFTRRNTNTIEGGTTPRISKELRDKLVLALLQSEPAILKILIEAFRPIVDSQFVKQNLWNELVPELRSVIQDSDLVNRTGNPKWKTINSLTVLQSVIRPFQYFLNPKIAKEPVPPQLELISQEILTHLISLFHQYVDDLCVQNKSDLDAEKSLLIMTKCIYYAVRSHMPSALVPLLPSISRDLIIILHSLRFEDCEEDGYMLKMKTGKRSLLIFCALITRHRKFSDKLMPDIINSAVKLVKLKTDFSKLDNLGERVMSLAFDVISRLLETGPGWRLVSPHFSSLLEYAIFPAIVMNEKDITEWEEDSDEYIRKNLPSELEEISGLREDLFTPRKSALNLLGVISISKGPPVAASVTSKRKKGEKNKQKGRSSMGELLVLPFLSKFPIPNAPLKNTTNDYFGVLMAYGSLVDFLREQKPAYTTTLIRSRVLPLYNTSFPNPYLVASANWILGELVSCIPEEMSCDVYSSLLKALTMEDTDDISSYPVRISAAGAIAQLVENEFFPPEWLPVLQVVVGRIKENDEEESAVMFEVLKTLVEAGGETVAPHIPLLISLLSQHILIHIPLTPDPFPQVVERGFTALSVMAQCWEESLPEEEEENDDVASGKATISKAFTDLLQQAWLIPTTQMEDETTESPSPSCIDESSMLLAFIISNINNNDPIHHQKVANLLQAWADLISNWNSWEEEEDSSIFNCIKQSAYLHKKNPIPNFITKSIVERICTFVSAAFSQYPSVIYRASASVHILLHLPVHNSNEEIVMRELATEFSRSAFCSFTEKQSKRSPLWKPLLLAICSCYLRYPDTVETTLEKDGFEVWARALFSISSSEFEHGLTTESEIKLTVLTLGKMITRMGNGGLLWECLAALMEASVRLKEVQEEEEDDEENEDEDEEEEDDDEDDDDDDDEDSEEDDVHEETEEQFLERCAQAAIDMENGTNLEEIDEEDEEQEIELGELEEVDALSIVKSLIESNHQILLQGPKLPPQLVSSFVEAFPESGLIFK